MSAPNPFDLTLPQQGYRREMAAEIANHSALFATLIQALPDAPLEKGMAIARLREVHLWAHAALCNAPAQVVAGEAAGDQEEEF